MVHPWPSGVIKINNKEKMRSLKSILTGLALLSILQAATSCDDSFIFDGEGDCMPQVQFVFKKHRQALNQIAGRETDMFYSVIERVHLFVYDFNTGELVFERADETENLNSAVNLKTGDNPDRCYMPVNLAPGKYRLVAWCGLNDDDANNAFHLTSTATRSNYSSCEVKLANTNLPVHEAKYDNVYHGMTVVDITDGPDSRQIIPIELTKDNNDIAVWVQHASKTFAEGDYEVVYTDANGVMHFEDNTIQSSNRLEYHPHTTSLLTSDTEYNGAEMETGALIAHISTARLMEAHSNDARLEVRTKTGETVFSIPFIKYVLNLQTATNDGQYYLDCEDTYNCSFYLTGESGTWMPARIIINNWVVVPNQNSDI